MIPFFLKFPHLKNGITIHPFSKARNLAIVLEISFSVTTPPISNLNLVHVQIPSILLLKHSEDPFSDRSMSLSANHHPLSPAVLQELPC